MHPVSFASARPAYPLFGNQGHRRPQSDLDTRKLMDELCSGIAGKSPTNLREVIAGPLEDAAREHDSAAVIRIESALMEFVRGLERAGISPAGLLHEIQAGLRHTRYYSPSTAENPMSTLPFSDWLDIKTSDYASELRELESPEEWTRNRLSESFNRRT